jgi:heptosyltransferase-1
MSAKKPHPEPKRILIVRLSAIGDIVMTSGLIPALSKRFPQAELYWLTEAACAPLLKHNPRLKEVLIWPRAQWTHLLKTKQYRALWREIATFRKNLKTHKFDWVLDGQGLLKSGLCSWFTSAPRRISIGAREGSRLLVHERLTPPTADSALRISSEYRQLATYLGAAEEDFQLDLAVGEESLIKAKATLQQYGLQPSRPLVALCPFTTRPQKHWLEDRWSELANTLFERGLQPVLLGGPADQVDANRIKALCPHLVDLTGKLKLDESVAIISECQQLIGVDTGLTHMGTALKIPTVALFGSTRPYLDANTPTTHVMYDELPCSPCHRRPICNGRFDCMKQLTVQGVLARTHILNKTANGAQK